MLQDEFLLTATAIHPQFKMIFINQYYPEYRNLITKKLQDEFSSHGIAYQQSQSASNISSFWDSDSSDELSTQSSRSGSVLTDYCYSEVNSTRELLQPKYKILKKIFLKYNTALASSGAVERLFSEAKSVLTVDRCRLDDFSFESQLLMSFNNKKLSQNF